MVGVLFVFKNNMIKCIFYGFDSYMNNVYCICMECHEVRDSLHSN